VLLGHLSLVRLSNISRSSVPLSRCVGVVDVACSIIGRGQTLNGSNVIDCIVAELLSQAAGRLRMLLSGSHPARAMRRRPLR